MTLMQLVLLTVNDCKIVTVDKQTASVRFYKKHEDIPFTDLLKEAVLIRGFENQLIVWID